jgi:hypothetical protein
MKELIYSSDHVRAFLTDERAESSYGQTVLLVEYSGDSPVHPNESIAYGMGDTLPSGSTASQFLTLIQAAPIRRRNE